MREERINIFMQSRAFSAACFAFALAMTVITWNKGGETAAAGDGILPMEGFRAFLQGTAGTVLNFILFVLTTVIMITVNRRFSYLGSLTTLDAALFSIFQGAVPALAMPWSDGSLVALITWLCTGSLFHIYDKRQATPQIFLIFAALSAMSMFQSAFVFLLPLFFIGIIQMRIAGLKGILAMIFGIATPYWIALGMGIVSPESLHFPEMVSVFELESIPFHLYFGFGVAALGVIAVTANTLTLIKYRLQLRVYNGFTLFTILFCIIMLVADSGNALAYLPLLNIVVGTQTAHWFVAKNYKRKYIALTFIILLACSAFGLYTFYLK